jgi:hypothetical protein
MNAHSSGPTEVHRGAGQVEHDARGASPGIELRPVLSEQAAEDEALREAIQRARRLTQVEDEPFRSLAFTVLLEHLLRGAPKSADAAVPAPRGQSPAAPPSTDMPVAEFLAQRRIESHPDRVVAIAYYHYHRFDGQGVTTKELVDAYTRARAKRPQNYPDVIASCVRRGYLVDGGRRDGMKSWVITRTGEAHVEQDL